ncbi:GGDEF domain-containing protein [Subtercola frigoramans]|uniref:Diguanylate cyclase (GGDEF)-like protein n=1 Tax=Subtercola frigoramans TaxID=120298 RepID=A0ABS2L9L8_9MICO|nr:GGDEF domain-containing protein [Subtercola frigoramans]MBM7473435.1 diguanylate cyclase (GGDEF)-like protein [Subtercola frigoramans]
MILDLQTLLIVNGVVVVLCGFSFVVNTAMRRNDAAGRLWSVSFIGGMLAVICYAIWGGGLQSSWILVIGNTAYTLVTGMIWAGCRVYNGRKPSVVLVGAGALIVAVTSVVTADSQGAWQGALALFPAVSLFSGLAAVESLRGRLLRNVNARILAAALWVVGFYYALRTIAFAIGGYRGEFFTTYLGPQQTTLLLTAFVILGTISLSILQVERAGTQALGDVTVGALSVVGLLSAASFAQQWQDWLERASFHGDRLEMVAVDIDSLPEMNTALGRNFGDGAITSVAHIVREHAPTSSLIGHPGAGRFVIVMVVSNDREAQKIASRVRDALVDKPIDETQGLRATASFGVVDTDVFGYDMLTLRDALDEATLSARSSGGNHIVVGRLPSIAA